MPHEPVTRLPGARAPFAWPVVALMLLWALCQPARGRQRDDGPAAVIVPPDASSQPSFDAILQRGAAHLVAVQEGDDTAEWPYEGVYRVRGEIPIGYRIGGTAICAMALMQAPAFADHPERQQAVHRAARFVIDGCRHDLMNPDYDGGYDVRGWGYTYGLLFLLRLESTKLMPADLAEPAAKAIGFYIDAIQQTEIATVGGWNYARGQGKQAVSAPSPFMTAPTLQALFEAKRLGHAVNAEVVQRGIESLERARTPTGSFRYAGNGAASKEAVPGSVGRMLASETTLFLAGRSSIANIRGALDAFLAHWQWLDNRRAQKGTHAPPYGIAPYYFYYAHYHAAQAVELLPEHERSEYRRRVIDLLMSVRLPDGTWNDRVFPRSSNYGTAMSMMALMMPATSAPAKWE